jgi:Domain of unknown function (DUF4159)
MRARYAATLVLPAVLGGALVLLPGTKTTSVLSKAAWAAAPAQAAPEEPLVEKVKAAIEKGVRFLEELENGQGSFEHTAVQISGPRPGGVTALAVVALLNCGKGPKDPVVQRCLQYLRGLAPAQSYTVGLQTMAFCLAGEKQDRQLVQRNLEWIEKMRVPGGWGYEARFMNSPDHSINQYVLLGIHEARLAGFKIDRKLLQDMYSFYNPPGHTGQWSYRNQRIPSLTMTTAGLCNLLITGQDLAEKRKLIKGIDPDCGKYPDDTTVARALDYIGRMFPNDVEDAVDRNRFQHPFYCLYGIERAGRLTGQRFFGGKDWYRIGCEYLVKVQKENGSWDGGNRGLDRWPPVATSLALLFLSKGRTPVLISKLAHGEPLDVETVEGRKRRQGGVLEEWNRKRNDVRHIVEFVSRELFDDALKNLNIRSPLAWQVFDPREAGGRTSTELAKDLLQSPILYINGHTFVIGRKEEEMLREYLENGGFIFAEACCDADEKAKLFDRKFRDTMKKITGSDLAELPSNHPVWTASKFKTPWKQYAREFPLEGIQQGCKTVVIYSPRPMAGYWENNDYEAGSGQRAFRLAANIVAYATGMQLPRPRLTEVEIVKESDGPRAPRGYLQVAQLVSSKGAQPLAPRAIPNLMAEISRHHIEVHRRTRNLTLTEDLVQEFKFFYMHDRNGFVVPKAENLENLKFTLENGGLLLADAACGSKAFDKSFRALVKAMWPDRKLEPIKVKENQKENELFSKQLNYDDRGRPFELNEVRYREEVDGVPAEKFRSGPPQLEGIKINGRWAVIYSKYDIGCALEKHQSTNCISHDYESARMLAKAVIFYALRH